MKLNHIGIAVADLETGRGFWEGALGMRAGGEEVVAGEGVKVAFLDGGYGPEGVHLELLEGLGPDSPISRFVAKRGPGIHHLCFEVEDLDQALAQAEARGYRRIKDPVQGAHHRRVVFLHPKETGGVLLELAER